MQNITMEPVILPVSVPVVIDLSESMPTTHNPPVEKTPLDKIPEKKSNKKPKKEVPVCQICDENLNKSVHLSIQCEYCQFESCRKCWETYILNETTVKCMNTACGKEWTRKFIRKSLTLTFINKQLKAHKEKILFDQERALLPATQPIIERKIQCAKIDKQIRAYQLQIRDIQQIVQQLYDEKAVIVRRKTTNERAQFVRACPDEDCRGFLSTQWKCGICEKWTCPECHLIKGFTRDAEHTCNPDDVATAKLLANDTKPCPKCATGIFKIDGCDQMWCTQCHTAFNWRTGNIENNIHNPHYYEWLRRNNNGEVPRNPLDAPCGRELGHHLYDFISRKMRLIFGSTTACVALHRKIGDIIRRTVHLRQVEARPQPNRQERNEELRVKYLMKEITQEEFECLLQRDDKKYNKTRELNQIYHIVSDTITDILFRFVHYLEAEEQTLRQTKKIKTSILNEIDQIIEYANECLQDVSYTYSSSLIQLTDTVQILTGNDAKIYTTHISIKQPVFELSMA
jgi:hypothetical protein